jgi:hypothetical protein
VVDRRIGWFPGSAGKIKDKQDAIYLISAEFVSYPPEVCAQERIACRE